MRHSEEQYYCAYHSVSYWVFKRDVRTGEYEPIMEVDTLEAGQSISRWLQRNPHIGCMITSYGNDNQIGATFN